jgi:hypothetical protein
MLMSWTPVVDLLHLTDSATLYTFQYRIPGAQWIGISTAQSNNYTPSVNNTKVTNLTPGTTYECRVIAYKKHNMGSAVVTNNQYVACISKIGTFTTIPVTFTKTQDIGTTALISWNDLSASGYVFQYKKHSASTWTGGSAATPYLKLTALDTMALYDCQLVVYMGGTMWGTTAIGSFTTGKVNYTVSNRAATSLDLTWTTTALPAFAWTSYKLDYKLTTSSTWTSLSPTSSTTSHITGLTSGATYNCRVTYYAGASWGICNIGTFTAGLAGKELSTNNNNVNIYPNPFVDRISMDLFSDQETKVIWNIYDITGKVILSGNESISTGNNTINIDASNLPMGVYMFNAIVNDQMKSFRILKQ